MSQNEFLLMLVIIGVACVVIFNFVVFYGAPFLPTKRARTHEVLDLLDLKPGQILLELGSGDGRILREAAGRGLFAIGYELNPLLVWWTRLRSWKYRKLITVHCANYWSEALPPADGIYVFLLQPYMTKLDQKLQQDIIRSVKLVSFAFPIPNKRPQKNQGGMYLYQYDSRRLNSGNPRELH